MPLGIGYALFVLGYTLGVRVGRAQAEIEEIANMFEGGSDDAEV